MLASMKKGCKFAASNNEKISQTSKINNNEHSKILRTGRYDG